MWRPENVHLDPGFLPEDRIILHADCNSYFASVEFIDHPEWKLVPMAVCGDPELRHGIILAKNELAKAYHIQTAETIYNAKRSAPIFCWSPPIMKSIKLSVNASMPSTRATPIWWSDSASTRAFST